MVIKLKRNPKNERIVKGILKSTFLYMFAVFGIMNAVLLPSRGFVLSNDPQGLFVTQIVSVLVAVIGFILATSLLIEAHEKEPKKKK